MRSSVTAVSAVLASVLLALLHLCFSGAAFAQSGYQTIQGTRVFTEVFQSQGYARFSNECGSQTLTQGQLQAGAIPNNIIPCPRGGSTPPPSSEDSRQICTDGSRCPSGHLCMRNNRCVPLSSERYCGGRSYCEPGFACAESGQCLPVTSPRYCGNKNYCSEGSVCAEEGKCIPANSERYCGNKKYCNPGFACAEEGKCIPTTSERYCGNKKYCSEGSVCAEEGKCIASTSERYCGNKKYCSPGFACAEEGKCIPTTSERYCGNKRYCQPGFACSNDGTACTQVATPAPPSDDRASCERDNKGNVDWVLTADAGARARFDGFRAAGRSDFEAVVAAQAHNPPVQASLRRCQAWVTAYLAGRGLSNGSAPPRAQAGTPPDCRCVSVVPTGADPGGNRGKEYTVTNSCGRMGISVKLLDKGNTTLSTWINVGDLELGGTYRIYAPQAYGIPSINGVQVRGQTASQICSFF